MFQNPKHFQCQNGITNGTFHTNLIIYIQQALYYTLKSCIALPLGYVYTVYKTYMNFTVGLAFPP